MIFLIIWFKTPDADRNTLHSLYLRKEELEIILNKRYGDKAKGYCIRSKAIWIKEWEVGSRYFLGLKWTKKKP